MDKGTNIPYQRFLISLALIALTLVVFCPALGHDFINFDDNEHVYGNPYVRAGVTLKGARWALTSGYTANWLPLTWLSHMLDVQLFGLNPSGHHLMNVLFHAANAMLLFLILSRMTGGVWRSAFVAAVFAVHPLRVESVAWVSERKDVLSTFFWMATLWVYVSYVARRGVGRYLATVLLLALGLMAKPMLVTLPCVLLLLDYWPLGRLRVGDDPQGRVKKSWELVREKLPLFALAVLSSVVTYAVQLRSGAVRSFESYPLWVRVSNACLAYVRYVGKTVWPTRLALFYPHPGEEISLSSATAAFVLLIVVTLLVLRFGRRLPYLVTGWFWYVGTLVPTIGIIQVGHQSLADRYTYVPLIGLYVIVAWGLPDLVARWKQYRFALGLSSVVVLTALMACTWRQLGYWCNSETLYQHTLRVTKDNDLAHLNLGTALAMQGRYEEAELHLREALRIMPRDANAHYNLGLAFAHQGKLDEAIAHFLEAVRIEPDYVIAYYNLGNASLNKEDFEAAAEAFSNVLRYRPDDADSHFGLGLALFRQGRLDDAAKCFSEALRHEPDDPDARKGLELVRARQMAREQARKKAPL